MSAALCDPSRTMPNLYIRMEPAAISHGVQRDRSEGLNATDGEGFARMAPAEDDRVQRRPGPHHITETPHGMKQNLSFKLQQKLSPQQIQLMKLLQIPTAHLEQRIEEEMEANPALEEGDAFDQVVDELDERDDERDSYDEQLNDVEIEDYFDDDELTAGYSGYTQNQADEEERKMIPASVGTTYHEHLERQLGMLELDERRTTVAKQIIGSIDDDGYLRREIEDIVDDLAFSQSVTTTEEEVAEILLRVQQFEPAGTGARDLQECLVLQMERRPMSPATDLALTILEDHFDAFTKKHYQKLMKTLEVDEDQLKAAIEEIVRLNPKPASGYSGGSSGTKGMHYIIPDFIVENVNGELQLRLNARNAPELRVSSTFKNMVKAYKESKKKQTAEQKKALLFAKRKVDSAKWFIDAIRQRQQTMLHTMQAIIDHQRDYFLTGDEGQLNPMILKDIADVTGLDISTISRVANSKYVQTEFGTILLKYFFNESIQNEEGEEVSTRQVKSVLADIIENEDKRKPLSDQKLMEALKEKGFPIARRTVAKYREQLGLPVARLRKEL